MKKKIILTKNQKDIIKKLNASPYNINYLKEWLNRSDTVFENAPAALMCMGARGFFEAVKAIEKTEGKDEINTRN